jgi:divalent metal cation (Fe/Co/Zn/Cd) transporter
VGGLFSLYRGIEKLFADEPIANLPLSIFVLLISFVAEAFALSITLQNVKRKSSGEGLIRFIRETKDTELLILTLEDIAALISLACALAGTLLSLINPVFDGVASVAISVILITVAIILGTEIKSLMILEGLPISQIREIKEVVEEEGIDKLIHLKTLFLSKNKVLITMKVSINPQENGETITNAINNLEQRIREKFPQYELFIYVEPDKFRTETD